MLLTTRGTVEKALHDIEAMKAQLEDLAREDVINTHCYCYREFKVLIIGCEQNERIAKFA